MLVHIIIVKIIKWIVNINLCTCTIEGDMLLEIIFATNGIQAQNPPLTKGILAMLPKLLNVIFPFGQISLPLSADYNSIRNGKVTLQRCMAHARQELANIVKTPRKDQLKYSVAYKGIQIFDRTFLKEKQFRAKSLTQDEKLAQRHSAEYQGLVNELNEYFDSMTPEKNSPLAKAKNLLEQP